MRPLLRGNSWTLRIPIPLPLLVLLLFPALASAQMPTLVINEVSYDPAESPEGPYEYFELYNYGANTVYLDGLVISDEGNNGTQESTFQFPGTQGVTTTYPVPPGGYVLVVADATGSTLSPDWECYAGGTDTDDAGVPNLVKTAGSATNLFLGNSGDGLTLSIGTTNGSVIPCEEVIDGVSWEGGGSSDVTAMSSTVCSDPASNAGYANGGSSNLQTLQRCPNGTDTDNSTADFTVADRTPKAANGCATIPPVITNLRYEPCFVSAGQQATVLCLVTDDNGDLTTVRVYYKLEAAALFDSLTMNPTGNPDEFGATLPGHADQAHVQYYVSAFDATGNETRSPSTAPGFLRSYRVGVQSIASLQVPAVADSCGLSTEQGKAVNVVGVVTHRAYEFSDNFFYIQQGTGPSSGIKVFTPTDSSFVPDFGDSVRVSGYVDEFNCLTEVVLFADCGTILGHNRKVRPRMLASLADIANEANESMLVQVTGPIDVTAGFDSTNLDNEFTVAAGPDTAYVGDDTFFPDGVGYSIVPEPGMILDALTGIVGYRRPGTTTPGPRAHPEILLRLEPRRDNDVDRNFTDVAEEDELAVAPLFHLGQNTPNPFNPRTTIEFAVPGAGFVALRVYDASGRLVRTLVQRQYAGPARERTVWDGRDEEGRAVPSGVYFCRLETNERVATRKMMLLK